MVNVKVTILMAVFNGGKYLDLAVNSLLKQDYKDVEVLIIDDCSTDGSIERIANHQHGRVRIHRNVRNIGQTASLNAGLLLAHGEFIARMDADDIAYPEWISQLMMYIEDNPSCAMASCHAVVIDEHGAIVKKLRSPMSEDEILLKSLFASPFNHVGCLMRRKVIIDAGSYDTSLKIAADYDLWSRILRAGQYFMVNRPQVGVAVRAHSSSVTAVNLGGKDIPEVCKIMNDNIKHFAGLSLSADQLQLWWKYKYAPQALTVQEYTEALILAEHIFNAFAGFKAFPDRQRINKLINAQQQVFFIRTCFGMARAGRNTELYAITRLAMKQCGLWSFYGLWWVVTAEARLCSAVVKIVDVYAKWSASVHERKLV